MASPEETRVLACASGNEFIGMTAHPKAVLAACRRAGLAAEVESTRPSAVGAVSAAQ
jgi:hypothetical protein